MDEATVQQLLLQLDRKATGAHAHTANKAAHYLKMFATGKLPKPNGVDAFVDLIRAAVYRDKWEPLADRMARWF